MDNCRIEAIDNLTAMEANVVQEAPDKGRCVRTPCVFKAEQFIVVVPILSESKPCRLRTQLDQLSGDVILTDRHRCWYVPPCCPLG